MEILKKINDQCSNILKIVRDLDVAPSKRKWIGNSFQLKSQFLKHTNFVINTYDLRIRPEILNHYSIQIYVPYNYIKENIENQLNLKGVLISKGNYKIGIECKTVSDQIPLTLRLFFSPIIDLEKGVFRFILSETPEFFDTSGILSKLFLLEKSLEAAAKINRILEKSTIRESNFGELRNYFDFKFSHVSCNNGFRFLALKKDKNSINQFDFYESKALVLTKDIIQDTMFNILRRSFEETLKVTSIYEGRDRIEMKLLHEKIIPDGIHCRGPKVHYTDTTRITQLVELAVSKEEANIIDIRINSEGSSSGGFSRVFESGHEARLLQCPKKAAKIALEAEGRKFKSEILKGKLGKIKLSQQISIGKDLTIIKGPQFKNGKLIVNIN